MQRIGSRICRLGLLGSVLLAAEGCGGDDGYMAQLRSGTDRERAEAATFLGAQRVAGAIPHLRLALRDTVPEVRAKVAWALGMLGAKDSLPDLLPLLRDPSRRVRQQAVVAVMYIEEPEAIPALELALKMERDAWVRSDLKRAIEYLRQFQGETELGEASFR